MVDGMRRYGQLSGGATQLTLNERWLTNFYMLVGTFNITWTAQQ